MRGGLELAPLTRYLDHDVMVDAARGFIYRGEECIPLVPLETKVLACLVRRMGEVVPFEEIIREVWGPGFEDPAGRNSLRVYINHLRQKLGDDARNPRFLFTRWKWGYKLQANRV
jgi:DNA-binding response OmpR family regulator